MSYKHYLDIDTLAWMCQIWANFEIVIVKVTVLEFIHAKNLYHSKALVLNKYMYIETISKTYGLLLEGFFKTKNWVWKLSDFMWFPVNILHSNFKELETSLRPDNKFWHYLALFYDVWRYVFSYHVISNVIWEIM